jgi:hypothetical protein
MAEKIFKEIFNVTFIIAVFTGLLYIAGYTYHGSYLSALFLPHDLFSVSFNEILVMGYYMLFIGGIFATFPAVIISLCVFMYLHLIGQLSQLKIIRRVIHFFFASNNNDNLLEKPEFLKKLIQLSLSILYFFVAILVVWFSLYTINNFSSEQATESAEITLVKAKEGVNSVTISINKTTIEGVILRCSQSHCAIFNNKKENILIYPVASIKNIEIERI